MLRRKSGKQVSEEGNRILLGNRTSMALAKGLLCTTLVLSSIICTLGLVNENKKPNKLTAKPRKTLRREFHLELCLRVRNNSQSWVTLVTKSYIAILVLFYLKY